MPLDSGLYTIVAQINEFCLDDTPIPNPLFDD